LNKSSSSTDQDITDSTTGFCLPAESYCSLISHQYVNPALPDGHPFTDDSKRFIDELLERYKVNLGKPDEWRGDPFNIAFSLFAVDKFTQNTLLGHPPS